MLRRWEEVKDAARDELGSGQRAAAAVLLPVHDSPMDRARYIAIRHELTREWNPRSGIEQTLVDQMAQAWTMQLHWQEIATSRMLFEHRPLTPEEVEWELPRVNYVEAAEHATAMADRWNRMFLRQLRALRDMRRYSPVVVQNAGQVNVAQQQVNVAQD